MGKEKTNEGIMMFEATVHDVHHHNSKTDDNSWCDVVVRVAGEAGVTAAMGLHKAKDKIVKIIYTLDE